MWNLRVISASRQLWKGGSIFLASASFEGHTLSFRVKGKQVCINDRQEINKIKLTPMPEWHKWVKKKYLSTLCCIKTCKHSYNSTPFSQLRDSQLLRTYHYKYSHTWSKASSTDSTRLYRVLISRIGKSWWSPIVYQYHWINTKRKTPEPFFPWSQLQRWLAKPHTSQFTFQM